MRMTRWRARALPLSARSSRSLSLFYPRSIFFIIADIVCVVNCVFLFSLSLKIHVEDYSSSDDDDDGDR